MPRTTTTKPQDDMTKIRADIAALQEHLTELRRDVTNAGKVKAAILKGKATDNISYMQDYGRAQMETMENNVKANPGKSMAIAFAAGLVSSFLFSGRR
jgi:ElaB/YqjD/DUF883 family membrane-anchored ribosome-binding protein